MFKQKISRRGFLSVLAGSAMLGLAGCGGNDGAACGSASPAASDLLDQITERGSMVFATEGPWSPWTFHNEAGDLTGYDIEVARAIAGQLGVEAEFAEGEWDGLLAGLDSGRYDTMANFMLCATMGLNGFIAMGVPQDWATHMIGHELTALHEITHGVTLAIVLPQLLRVMRQDKHDKLLQYATRVLGITEGDDEACIDEAIRRTEEFFHSLGIATRLSDYGVGQDTVDEIVRRFTERGAVWGERHDVTPDKVRKILEMAL